MRKTLTNLVNSGIEIGKKALAIGAIIAMTYAPVNAVNIKIFNKGSDARNAEMTFKTGDGFNEGHDASDLPWEAYTNGDSFGIYSGWVDGRQSATVFNYL